MLIKEDKKGTIDNLKNIVTKNCGGVDNTYKIVTNPINSKEALYKKTEKGNWVFVYDNLTIEVIDPNTKQTLKSGKFACEGYETDKDRFINDFLSKNKEYTKEKPSDYLIGTEYQKVDMSTVAPDVFSSGEYFLYKRIGTESTTRLQQPEIESALAGAGWTLTEPSATSPEYRSKMDIRDIEGGDFAKFYEPLNKMGKSTFVWRMDSSVSGLMDNYEVKDIIRRIKDNKVGKKDCRLVIKTLYTVNKNKSDINSGDLMKLKAKAWACYKQDTKFMSGALGVGDELQYLVSDDTRYGLGEFLKQKTNESTDNIQKIIKENLIKKSNEKQTQLISENKIITSRYNLISEGVNIKSKKQTEKFFEMVITETAYLHSQGYNQELIKESFLDMLKGLFGNASTSIFQYFKEHIARWFVTKFTPLDPDSWMGNIIIVAIGNLPVTDLHKLTNCSFVSNMLSKDIAEGIANKIKNESGFSGAGYDILRNALIEMAEDSTFGQKLQHKVSEFICPKLQGLQGKMDAATSQMKSKALT
jgi:hypothetical protein